MRNRYFYVNQDYKATLEWLCNSVNPFIVVTFLQDFSRSHLVLWICGKGCPILGKVLCKILQHQNVDSPMNALNFHCFSAMKFEFSAIFFRAVFAISIFSNVCMPWIFDCQLLPALKFQFFWQWKVEKPRPNYHIRKILLCNSTIDFKIW